MTQTQEIIDALRSWAAKSDPQQAEFLRITADRLVDLARWAPPDDERDSFDEEARRVLAEMRSRTK